MAVLPCFVFLGRFDVEPQSQEVIEGATATFFCQCSRDALLASCSWSINGSKDDGRPGIDERIEGPSDNRTSVLTIAARPEFNSTHLQCIATVAGIVHRSQEAVLTTKG